jgi:death on curing protein
MRDPVWIEEHDVLVLHDHLLALEGGAVGLRSQALLQSALARPRQLHAYGDGPDIIDMAASYTAGMVRNHPFVDGNKRTAFIIGVLFLELNGYRFIANEADATQAVLQLTAGRMNEDAFATWLRANVRKSTR